MRLLLRVLPAFLALPAAGQQFQVQPGAVPGPARWSEGVEFADVDGDGDLDVLVADGEGFGGAGAKRQNVLLVNQLVESGSFSLTDESVARLGARVSNAKGVTTGDVNGDGWVDLLYLNAFNTDVPFLYINRGASQPGFFDMESASRGFTTVLSSAGAQFGDLDDDGDLDVIVCDSGPSFLDAPGGRPRLYLNDGAGFFTETAMGAPIKEAHMDVQLYDMDGDWDLDFFGACREANGSGYHYLMLNDGQAGFNDASSLLPSTSSAVYEAEVADLDGDTDHDLFFVSLSGFQEGAMRNDLVENAGTLGFTKGSSLSGFVDDNEITLLDYNTDGALDVFVASLGARERLYRNDGGLGFTEKSNRVSAVSDSSLDSAAGDLDNDGDYDIVTVQGESNPGQWGNKLYLNTGNPDDLPPVVVALDVPGQAPAWPAVLHARVRDHVRDDGVDYVTSRAFAAPFADTTGSATLNGDAFAPAQLAVASGDSIVLENQNGQAETLANVSSGYPFDYTLQDGQLVEHVFLVPGQYTIQAAPSGAAITVTVSGAPTVVEGFAMGGGQHRFAIPRQAQVPGDSFAVELLFEDGVGNRTVITNQLVLYPGIGSTYCGPAVPNSSGESATLTAFGSTLVADDDFHLRGEGFALNKTGYYIASLAQGFVPNPGGSQGNLCLGGTVRRYRHLAASTGPDGILDLDPDLQSVPGHGAVQPGETWNWQAWFRDKNPNTTSNFSDAWTVTFQ